LEPYYAHLQALPGAEQAFLFKRVNERVWSDSQRQAFLSSLRSLARGLPARQKDLPNQLKESDVPTLALWGEADRINPPANGQRLVELQPSVRLVLVPDAGHNVHQERPAEVLSAMV
jgi:pimeloyl-ACP methyl ester carboxylesterase